MKSPILEEFGLVPFVGKNVSIPVISFKDITNLLAQQNDSFVRRFRVIMYGQTCSGEGYYWYDVESALKQIQTNKQPEDWD